MLKGIPKLIGVGCEQRWASSLFSTRCKVTIIRGCLTYFTNSVPIRLRIATVSRPLVNFLVLYEHTAPSTDRAAFRECQVRQCVARGRSWYWKVVGYARAESLCA